jgi:glutamate N-acetyltransferase/amino-acid N-acetyltransferase
MICPNMATMLCFLTTDACIEPKALAKALPDAVNESFNAITVDGDMSTNDAVIILANSLAGNPRIKYGTKHYKIFCDALKYVALYLAKEIVKDGEGASKFVEVEVKGARTKSDAQKIASEIANSSLVKTAIAGEDPNVGRIASAAGASGVKFNLSKLEVCLSGLKIMSRGRIYDQVRSKARRLLQNNEIRITVNLNAGNGRAVIWTCDLTEGYIKINAKYN